MIDAAARGLAAKALANAKPTLAGRLRVGVMGDSISADAYSSSATQTNWTHWGYVAWLRRYMGQRIDLPGSRVYATAGYTIAQIISTWLPRALADKPDVVIVHCGTNSLGSDTIANLKTQLQSIYDQLRAAGIFVVAVPIRAHGSASPFSASSLLQFSYLNNWIKTYARSVSGMMTVDINPTYLDFATGLASSTLLRDGIHDTIQGAQAMGQALATALTTLMPGVDDRFIHLGDVYDATNNPTGNLLANGLMAGSGGTLLNGATGTPPTSWRAVRGSSGSTMSLAASSEAISGLTNLNRAVLTLGGTADGATATMDQAVSSNFSVGDTLTFEVDIDWTVTSGTVNGIFAHLICYSSGFATLADSWDGAYNSSNGAFAAASGSGTYRTDPIVVPANTTSLDVLVGMVPGSSGAISAVLKASRATLRKVI